VAASAGREMPPGAFRQPRHLPHEIAGGSRATCAVSRFTSAQSIPYPGRASAEHTPFIETDAAHLRRARQVQRLVASRGLRGRKVPDPLIAAVAEESGL
jgi:hypothetical protein